ncbi:MAG: rRNA maturation RNase YbeY [Pseudomonadota bacterium]
MSLVETVIEGGGWPADLPALAERAAGAALTAAGVAAEGREIALLAAGDARIAALNLAFRGKEGATNVLSWPAAPPEDESLGDIALAWETCAAEAEAAGRPLADHLAHLIVHGTLHLLGYDHGTEAEATKMETIEVEALALIGVANPY